MKELLVRVQELLYGLMEKRGMRFFEKNTVRDQEMLFGLIGGVVVERAVGKMATKVGRGPSQNTVGAHGTLWIV